MARPIRVEFEGAYYHLMARGNERKAIFKDDRDRQLFLQTLQEVIGQYGLILHCYCLMSNHYHLVIQTPRGNLSRAMAWFQGTYTNRYNRRHQRSGHLFQGRYKSQIIEADEYAIKLICYIHLNPVRGRNKSQPLDQDKRQLLEQYAWSSHCYYSGKLKAADWINLDWLSYYSRKLSSAQRLYRNDISQAFEQQPASPFDQIRGGFVLGSEKFWEKVWDIMDGKKAKHETRWREYHGRDRIRQQVQQLVEKESDARIKMWIRVRLGGERLVDIAREQGYRDGAGVCQVVTRLETSAIKNPSLRTKLEKCRRNLSIVMR